MLLFYETGEVAAEEMIIDDNDDNSSHHSGGEEEVSIIAEVSVPPIEKNAEPDSQPMEEECICVDISDSEKTTSQSVENKISQSFNPVSEKNKYDSDHKPFLSIEESLDIEQVFDSHEQNNAIQDSGNQGRISSIEQTDFQNHFYNADQFSNNQISYMESLNINQNQISNKNEFNVNQILCDNVNASTEQSSDFEHPKLCSDSHNQISGGEQCNDSQNQVSNRELCSDIQNQINNAEQNDITQNQINNVEQCSDIQNQITSPEQSSDIQNQICNADNDSKSQITSINQVNSNQNEVSSIEYLCDDSYQISSKTDVQTCIKKSAAVDEIKDDTSETTVVTKTKKNHSETDNIGEQALQSSEHVISVEEEKIVKSGYDCIVKMVTDSTEVQVDESTESCSSEIFNFAKDASISSVPEYIPIKERISRAQQTGSRSSKFDDDDDDQIYPSLLLHEQLEMGKSGASCESEMLVASKQPPKSEKIENIAESSQDMETDFQEGDSADSKPVSSTTSSSTKDVSQRLTERFDFLSKNSEFYENNKLYRKTMTLLKSDMPFNLDYCVERKPSRKTRTFVFKKEEGKTEMKTTKSEDLEQKADTEIESSEKFLESWHSETYEQFSSSLQKGRFSFIFSLELVKLDLYFLLLLFFLFVAMNFMQLRFIFALL